MNARVAASNIVQTAYAARTLEIAANLERQTNIIWQKDWTWSVGAELLASDERDIVARVGARQTYFIGALPATLASMTCWSASRYASWYSEGSNSPAIVSISDSAIWSSCGRTSTSSSTKAKPGSRTPNSGSASNWSAANGPISNHAAPKPSPV